MGHYCSLHQAQEQLFVFGFRAEKPGAKRLATGALKVELLGEALRELRLQRFGELGPCARRAGAHGSALPVFGLIELIGQVPKKTVRSTSSWRRGP